MPEKYDPRAPRRNTEFWDLVRTLKGSCGDMRYLDTYTQFKGQAAVIRAVIDMLMDEPEFVYDLASGASTEDRGLFLPQNMSDAPEFLEEGPFDQAGEDSGKYFYYNYSKSVTPLFTSKGDDFGFLMSMSVYWVLQMERCYASDVETTMHVTSEQALNRMCPSSRRSRLDRKKPYYILMDPRGWYTGKSAPLVGTSTDFKRAVKTADRLSSWLGIRFIAAKLIARIDTH